MRNGKLAQTNACSMQNYQAVLVIGDKELPVSAIEKKVWAPKQQQQQPPQKKKTTTLWSKLIVLHYHLHDGVFARWYRNNQFSNFL